MEASGSRYPSDLFAGQISYPRSSWKEYPNIFFFHPVGIILSVGVFYNQAGVLLIIFNHFQPYRFYERLDRILLLTHRRRRLI